VFAISARGVRDADWDGLQGANRSHSRSHGEDLQRREKRPSPRPYARAEIVNTFLSAIRKPSFRLLGMMPKGAGLELSCADPAAWSAVRWLACWL